MEPRHEGMVPGVSMHMHWHNCSALPCDRSCEEGNGRCAHGGSLLPLCAPLACRGLDTKGISLMQVHVDKAEYCPTTLQTQ